MHKCCKLYTIDINNGANKNEECMDYYWQFILNLAFCVPEGTETLVRHVFHIYIQLILCILLVQSTECIDLKKIHGRDKIKTNTKCPNGPLLQSDVRHYLRIRTFCFSFLCSWSTWWCIWFMHRYTSRKVAGFH
jgi:hypothetical protein